MNNFILFPVFFFFALASGIIYGTLRGILGDTINLDQLLLLVGCGILSLLSTFGLIFKLYASVFVSEVGMRRNQRRLTKWWRQLLVIWTVMTMLTVCYYYTFGLLLEGEFQFIPDGLVMGIAALWLLYYSHSYIFKRFRPK